MMELSGMQERSAFGWAQKQIVTTSRIMLTFGAIENKCI